MNSLTKSPETATPVGRLTGLFGNDRLFWLATAWMAGAIAIGKGLLMPNRWSATQCQVDYSFGFVKRGLLGELLTIPLGLFHYKRFVEFSLVVLFLLIALLAAYTSASGVARRLGIHQAPALFFSSYALTYITSLAGYFDLVLGVLTIAVLLVRNRFVRICLALPVSIVALLIHEMFLFVFLPVVLLSVFLQPAVETDVKGALPSQGTRSWAVVLIALVALIATVWISLRPSLRPDRVSMMEKSVEARADFEVRKDFFDVMSRSATENFRVTRSYYTQKDWWRENRTSLIVFGPTLALMLALTRKLIRSDPSMPAGAAGFATRAALAPLAMHLLGWDAGRWNALSVLAGYLVLLTVSRSVKSTSFDLTPAWRNAIVLAIILNSASGGLQMDHRPTNDFPFAGTGFPFGKLRAAKVVAPDR